MFSRREGSIVVALSVFIIGMLALTALGVDYAMMIANKRAIQNVTEMMAIAAMGYHTDENFDTEVAGLSLTQQHVAKTVLGMRNAYHVWKHTKPSIINSSKYADPFGAVNWSARYENLMSDINADGDMDTTPATALSGYDSSKVRFLKKSIANSLTEISDSEISTLSDPLLVRAAKNEITTQGGASPLRTILASFFGATTFNVTSYAVAEISNSGKTNAVVILIDRSISMAGKTGDSTYLQPTDAGYNEAYPGLSSSDLSSMQNSAKVIQPMTDMLYAARTIPKILGRANWFTTDPNRFSKLSLMTFDLIAESVGAASGPNDHVDNNTCAGCDQHDNAYKKIRDRIDVHLTGSGLMGRGGLPELAGLCVSPQACMECNTVGCKSTCDPVNDEIFHSVSEAKCFASTGAGMALPASELDSFFPWSGSDESQGLEVAIELIRQQRKQFYDLFNGSQDFNIDDEFQGQIVLFSDGLVNAFHDQDYTWDPFPKYTFAGGVFTHICDNDIWADYSVREGAPTPDPGAGQMIDQPKPIPIAWRKDFNASTDLKPAVTWISNCWTGHCSGETYHNGAQLYAKLLSPGTTYSPTDTSVPVSSGVWNSSITGGGLDVFACPDFDCNKVLVGRNLTNMGDTTRKPGITLYCADLQYMDYVDWANANGIIINTFGFGDLGMAYNPSTPSSDMRRQFLLTYATDPDGDGKRKGFFLRSNDDTPCGAQGTGCSKFRAALHRAFTNLEGRLTDKSIGSLIT